MLNFVFTVLLDKMSFVFTNDIHIYMWKKFHINIFRQNELIIVFHILQYIYSSFYTRFP